MVKCPKCKNSLDLLYDEIYECKNCDFMIRKNIYEKKYNATENPWYIDVSNNNELWYKDNIEEYPMIIAEEYSILYKFIVEGNIHGAFLKMRDVLEVIIKLPVLISMNHILLKTKKTDKDYFLLEYMLRKSLNLGEWREIANKIFSNKLNDNQTIHNILKDVKKLYFNEKIDIVKWRNESIGHGALKYSSDNLFQKEIVEKLKAIAAHFKRCDSDYKNLEIYLMDDKNRILLKGTNKTVQFTEGKQLYLNTDNGLEELYPFISIYKNGLYFFDGYIDKKSKVSILNYNNGHKEELIKTEVSERFHTIYNQSMQISKKVDMINKLIETNKSTHNNLLLESELLFNDIQDIIDYTDTSYIENWLKERMDVNNKGIFLLQMERGMGKTTFVKTLEREKYKWIETNKIITKCCYLNDIFIKDIEFFNDNIQDLLRTNAEGKICIKGVELKSILNKLDNDKCKFLNIISHYKKTYYKYFNKEKLILVIDGIDELNNDDFSFILNLLPSYEELQDGVYILLTCRTDAEISLGLMDGLKNLALSSNNKLISYRRSTDNLNVLKKHVEEKFHITNEKIIKKIIEKAEYRFLYLDIIKTLYDYGYNILNISSEKDILLVFLEYIKLTIGEKHFEGVKRVMFVLALASESLTLSEISYIYGETDISFEFLLYINEIKGLLKIDRSYRGNVMALSNKELKEFVISSYKVELEIIIKGWIERVIDIISEENKGYNDGQSYLVSNIFSYRGSVLEVDYNKLINIETIFNLTNYVSYIANFKYKRYISNRYYKINHEIINLERFILNEESDAKWLTYFFAQSLSNLGDSLFENIETDYEQSIEKYKSAIEKRIGILDDCNIKYDLLLEKKYNTKELDYGIKNVICDIAEDYINIGRVYYRIDKPNKAKEFSVKGINLYNEYLDYNSNRIIAHYALALLELARIYEKCEEYDESIKTGLKSKKIFLELIDKEYSVDTIKSCLARVEECFGETFFSMKNKEEAIARYKNGIEILESFPEDKINERYYLVVLYNNIGKIYLKNNKMSALKYFQQTVEIYKKLEYNGIIYDKLKYVEACTNIGMINLDINELEAARAAFKLSLELIEQGIPLIEVNPNVKAYYRYLIFMGMADTLFLLNEYGKCLECYSKWIESIQLDSHSIISVEDIRITLERIKESYMKVGDNYKQEMQDKRIKRLGKLINNNKTIINKSEVIYVLSGYKEMQKFEKSFD